MNKKQTVIASVAKQSLAALATASLVFGLVACGSDSSSATDIECLEDENCLEEDSSDSKEESSSAKANSSSSSAKKNSSSSSVSSDSKTSSSSTGKDVSSSSVSSKESSSSVEESSSSSEEESSSSVELKITYLSETPNAVDLEVSGDTLFAVFQRYTLSDDGYTALFNDNGLLALYKLSDGTLLDTIPLVTKNPSAVKVVKGNVYVATHGEYNTTSWGTDADDNRGIEKVDLKNKKSELWVSGTKLGAGVYTMDVDEITDKAYVAVYKAYQDVPAVEVYLASKTVKTINGIIDATGSILFDSKSNLAYIGDRGSIDFNTGNMTTMVAYTYDGTNLTALYNDEIYYQPAGIAVIDSEVFVYFSDYNTAGKLYWIDGGNISDENISFSTDTKIVTVNNKIIVLDRKNQGSIALVDPSSKTVSWKKSISAENPQDIVAIDNSTAWVAMYNTAEIRKISLVDGSEISSIDTKDFCAKSTD